MTETTKPGEQLLQPHEGVRGRDRTGDYLLSLDDRAVAHRDALISMAMLLRSACLVGQPAPVVKRMAARLNAPKVGDLVVEWMMAGRDVDTRLKAFGYLVAWRREWASTDEEWERWKREEADGYRRLGFVHVVNDSERMVEPDAWYVQYGPDPGDVCRWSNCSFMALPVGADSGFALRPRAAGRDTG